MVNLRTGPSGGGCCCGCECLPATIDVEIPSPTVFECTEEECNLFGGTYTLTKKDEYEFEGGAFTAYKTFPGTGYSDKVCLYEWYTDSFGAVCTVFSIDTKLAILLVADPGDATHDARVDVQIVFGPFSRSYNLFRVGGFFTGGDCSATETATIYDGGGGFGDFGFAVGTFCGDFSAEDCCQFAEDETLTINP